MDVRPFSGLLAVAAIHYADYSMLLPSFNEASPSMD